MILRPQSRGDLRVPVHKGTEPSWRSWDQPMSPGRAAFNTVLCLKRLQSRSDARLGAKHRVGCDDAAAMLTLPLCMCVHACVCDSWKKGSSWGAGGLCGVHPWTDAQDLCHGLCGGVFKCC